MSQYLDQAAAQCWEDAQRTNQEPLEDETVELLTEEEPLEVAESEQETQPVKSDTEQPPDDKFEEQPQEGALDEEQEEVKLDEEQEKVELEEQQQEGKLEEKPEEASEEEPPDEQPQEKGPPDEASEQEPSEEQPCDADGYESPGGEDEKEEEFDSSDEKAWYRDKNRKRSALETVPWDLPLEPPAKIEKRGYTSESIHDLRTESLAAHFSNTPWQRRGPKPTEEGQTWRSQRWRPTGGPNGAGRWGNSGGKNKQ